MSCSKDTDDRPKEVDKMIYSEYPLQAIAELVNDLSLLSKRKITMRIKINNVIDAYRQVLKDIEELSLEIGEP